MPSNLVRSIYKSMLLCLKMWHNKEFRILTRRGYIITYELSCACRLYEFKGFLGRNALIVHHIRCPFTFPSEYILQRRMKDVKYGFNIRSTRGRLIKQMSIDRDF